MRTCRLTVVLVFVSLLISAPLFAGEGGPAPKETAPAGSTQEVVPAAPKGQEPPAAETPASDSQAAGAAKDKQAEIYQSYERLVRVMDLVESRYVQPVGTFRGTIKPPDGPAVAVADLLGVTEDHAAKW